MIVLRYQFVAHRCFFEKIVMKEDARDNDFFLLSFLQFFGFVRLQNFELFGRE